VRYAQVAAAMLEADAWLAGGAGRALLIENLRWRGIEPPFRSGRPSYRERADFFRRPTTHGRSYASG
jgi:hypothetical protein